MRYAKSESTNILALFNNGDTVTIDIYRLSDNTKVVDGEACSEIAETGVFKYEFSYSVSQKEEFLWIMSNGSYEKYGKIVLGGYMDNFNNSIIEHRNVVEPNIDVPISSRSSHTPADIWNYSVRELTNPDNYKADISDLAKEATVQAVKDQTDRLQFDAQNNVIATLAENLTNTLSLILGLVQHNYRLFNTSYVLIGKQKKLASATVRIYPTKEDCENNTNPLKTYSLTVEYDQDGKLTDYKCVEV